MIRLLEETEWKQLARMIDHTGTNGVSKHFLLKSSYLFCIHTIDYDSIVRQTIIFCKQYQFAVEHCACFNGYTSLLRITLLWHYVHYDRWTSQL